AAPRAPSRSVQTPGGTEQGGKAKGGEARGALLRPCRGAGGRGQGAVTGRGQGIVARRAAPFLRYRPAADVIGGMGRRVGAGRALGSGPGLRDGAGQGAVAGAARLRGETRRSGPPISTGSGCDRGEWVGVSGPGGLVGAEPGAATHGGASLCGTGPSTLPPHRVAEGYARRCSVRRTLNTRREENMM